MPTVSLQAAGIEIGHAGLRSELVHAGGGLVVLLTTTILAIYKPRGLTPVRKAQTEKPNVGLDSPYLICSPLRFVIELRICWTALRNCDVFVTESPQMPL